MEKQHLSPKKQHLSPKKQQPSPKKLQPSPKKLQSPKKQQLSPKKIESKGPRKGDQKSADPAVLEKTSSPKKQQHRQQQRQQNALNEKKKREVVEETKKKMVAIIPSDDECMELDGSLMEGGGQVLRNGFGYGALFKRSLIIKKIRAGRDRPGLRAQHLCGIQLVRDIFGGKLIGAELNSTEVYYEPGEFEPRDSYEFLADTKTAGSVCLLMQVALPCLLFLPRSSKAVLKGGTNAIKAPPIDYGMHVFAPMFQKLFKQKIKIDLKRRGFYPRGLGEVELSVEPAKGPLPPFNLTKRGDLVSIRGVVITSQTIPSFAAAKIANAARAVLSNSLKNTSVKAEITYDKCDTASSGSCIMLIAETSGGCLFASSQLFERKKKGTASLAEQEVEMGELCAKELLEELEHGACVDKHLQDQFIIFMALANGKSSLLAGPLELHTETAIFWAEKLSGAKFTVTKISDKQNLIECDGVGYRSRFSSASSVAAEKKDKKKE